MGLNSVAPSFLVPELAEMPVTEMPVIRGQTRIPLSDVIPGMVVHGICP